MTSSRQEEVEAVARQTLVDHGLLSIPVNPVVVAKKLGIRLFHAVFSEPKFTGMIARRSEAVTILVKDGDSPYRKRFTVAHEIGHCLLHFTEGTEEIVDTDADFFRTPPTDKTAWTEHRRREWEANIFAAELLMPTEEIRNYWRQIPASARTVESMAKIFQVSEEAMGIRLSGLGLLDDNE